jgi:butyrate kinase
MNRILAVNPGSSSTKIGVFDDLHQVLIVNISHGEAELEEFHGFHKQYQFRKKAILDVLMERGIPLESLSAVVGRGGVMNPVESGAYLVNDAMKEDLGSCPKYNAANLGAWLADELAAMAGVKAFVYDPVSVDEMWDLSRLTGLPGVERTSIGHVLNMKAVARQWAADHRKPYEEANLIIAHLGGGITLSLHHKGRLVDLISDDEGPFGPERVGHIPARKLIQYIFSRGLTEQEAFDALQGNGAGLHGLLGTPSTIEVEKRIDSGDEKALLCYKAMAFNVAKGIGQLATEVSGKVDQIILTGGTSHSLRFTQWIKDSVSFIAPVAVLPGERELEAMAEGVLQVLTGKASAKTYTRHGRPPLLT